MNPFKKKIEVDKLKYYEIHLSFVNCFLTTKMTPMEIKVLCHFMCLDKTLSANRFCSRGRRIVIEQLKIQPAGLSNFLRTLRLKRFIKEEAEIISIWPVLIPEENNQRYDFLLVNTENDALTKP